MLQFETIGQARCIRLGVGAMAIGHRPPLRALRHLREAGFSHIVTVLSVSEGPHTIADAAARADLGWYWLDLGSTKNLPARAKPGIAEALRAISAMLDGGAILYLHCSAGIHRTGMIAAALMFQRGLAEAEVREALAALRPVTAQDVGEARLEWARSFATS